MNTHFLKTKAHILFLGICAFLLAAVATQAQRISKGGRGVPDVRSIDQEEGRLVIEKFRRQRLDGDFIFKIDLWHFPYRGEKKLYQGLLMGTWNFQGPLNRLALWPAQEEKSFELGLLVQGGRDPSVWKVRPDQASERLDVEALFDPMLDDFIYTPFDILMPYVFWEHFEYTGSTRVRSRPVHLFLMYPPEDFKKEHPEVHAVRMKIDAGFNDLITAELVDKELKVLRSFNVVSTDKTRDQYVVKTIDLVDRVARHKTRMKVVLAAVGLKLPAAWFDAEQFDADFPDVSRYSFERL